MTLSEASAAAVVVAVETSAAAQASAAQWRSGEKSESSGRTPTRAREALGLGRLSSREEDAVAEPDSDLTSTTTTTTATETTTTKSKTKKKTKKKAKAKEHRREDGSARADGESSGESCEALTPRSKETQKEGKKKKKSKTKKKNAKSKSERSATDEPPAGGAMAELRRGLLDLQPQASDEQVIPIERKKKKTKTKAKTKGKKKSPTKTKKKKKSRTYADDDDEAEAEESDDDRLPPTVYVDCIVVEARDLQIPTSTGWGFFGSGTTTPALYCAVQLGSGTQEFRTWSAEEKTPVWNAGLTFIYRRTIDAALTEEDDLPMTIADNAVLILTVRNRAGRLFAQELALGEAYVVLETLEDEAVHDVWLPLRPPAKTWSLETLLQPPPEPPLGQLHIILQKSLQPQAGLLAYYGKPSRAIPLRALPGDVVLFSNTELVRQTIKIVQGSEWDHIGLVVPRPDNEGLFLLEAIVDGVRIFRLDHRLDFYRETAKIAIRRLEVNRTPEMLQALTDFAQEIAGKPYCSLLDIVKTYGTGAVPAEGTWFCSQLVAAAFQRMGILAAQPPAWAFLPGDFVADHPPSHTHNPSPDAAPQAPPKLQLLQGRLSDILISPMKGAPDLLS